MGVCESPCDGRASCPGRVPVLHPELLGQAPATVTKNWNKQLRKIIIFLVFIRLS